MAAARMNAEFRFHPNHFAPPELSNSLAKALVLRRTGRACKFRGRTAIREVQGRVTDDKGA